MAKERYGQRAIWPKSDMAKERYGQRAIWPKSDMADPGHSPQPHVHMLSHASREQTLACMLPSGLCAHSIHGTHAYAHMHEHAHRVLVSMAFSGICAAHCQGLVWTATACPRPRLTDLARNRLQRPCEGLMGHLRSTWQGRYSGSVRSCRSWMTLR